MDSDEKKIEQLANLRVRLKECYSFKYRNDTYKLGHLKSEYTSESNPFIKVLSRDLRNRFKEVDENGKEKQTGFSVYIVRDIFFKEEKLNYAKDTIPKLELYCSEIEENAQKESSAINEQETFQNPIENEGATFNANETREGINEFDINKKIFKYKKQLVTYGLSLLLLIPVIFLFYYYIVDNNSKLSKEEQLQLDELQKITPDDPSFTYDSDSILSLKSTIDVSNIVIFPKGDDLGFTHKLKYTLDSLKIKDSLSIATYINKYSINDLENLYRNMHYKNIDYVIIEKNNNQVQLFFPSMIRSIANPKFFADDFKSGKIDIWLSSLTKITMEADKSFLAVWVASNVDKDATTRLKYIKEIEKKHPKYQFNESYLLHKAHVLRDMVSYISNTSDNRIWEKLYISRTIDNRMEEKLNDIYKQLLLANPQKNDYYIEYASSKKSKDRFLAEQMITKVIALQDSSLLGMQYLDRAFLRSNHMQKHQEALKDFETAYQFFNNELVKFHILRRAVEEKITLNDYKGAINGYKILIDKDTVSGFHYFFKIADCYEKMKQENHALEYYTKYIESYKKRFPKKYKNDETIGEAYSKRYLIYLNNSDLKKAMQDIDSARLYQFNPDVTLTNRVKTLRKQLKHKYIMNELKDYRARDAYKQKKFDSLSKLLNIELILLEDNKLSKKQKDSIKNTKLIDDPYFTELFFYENTLEKDDFFVQ